MYKIYILETSIVPDILSFIFWGERLIKLQLYCSKKSRLQLSATIRIFFKKHLLSLPRDVVTCVCWGWPHPHAILFYCKKNLRQIYAKIHKIFLIQVVSMEASVTHVQWENKGDKQYPSLLQNAGFWRREGHAH